MRYSAFKCAEIWNWRRPWAQKRRKQLKTLYTSFACQTRSYVKLSEICLWQQFSTQKHRKQLKSQCALLGLQIHWDMKISKFWFWPRSWAQRVKLAEIWKLVKFGSDGAGILNSETLKIAKNLNVRYSGFKLPEIPNLVRFDSDVVPDLRNIENS